MLCKPFFKSLACLGKASQPKGNVMLTDKILENDNIIVTVPDYLQESGEESEEPGEEPGEESEEPGEEPGEESGEESEEPGEESQTIIVESSFDESNIIMEMEQLKQISMYSLSFNAGLFVFVLLYLCVKFFKIFF